MPLPHATWGLIKSKITSLAVQLLPLMFLLSLIQVWISTMHIYWHYHSVAVNSYICSWHATDSEVVVTVILKVNLSRFKDWHIYQSLCSGIFCVSFINSIFVWRQKSNGSILSMHKPLLVACSGICFPWRNKAVKYLEYSQPAACHSLWLGEAWSRKE